MKRLTFMDGFKEPCYRIDGTVYKNEVAQCLSAYEDTGLTPEEYKAHADALRKLDSQHMHDLLVAEQDGRLVALPSIGAGSSKNGNCRPPGAAGAGEAGAVDTGRTAGYRGISGVDCNT